MNKNDYYKNKIMYALQKIDYAKARMSNKKPENLLSKIYFVMENYAEIDYLTLTRVFKDIPETKIKVAVKYLADLGVLSWSGKRLTKDKMVRMEKKDYATFVRELEENLKKKTGKERLNLKDIQDVFTMADVGEPEKSVKVSAQKEDKEQKDDWVEIEYAKDVFLRVKKTRLKKLLD